MSEPASITEEFEEVSASFEFDETFQAKIAALAIRDANFARRTDGLVSPGYFESEATGVLVALAQEHFKKYKSLPSSTPVWANIIKSAVSKRRIRDDMKSDVIAELKLLLKTSVSDRDYIIDEVASFAKHQAIQNAMLEAVELADKKCYAEVQEKLQAAFRVGANTEFVDVDFWNSIEGRTQYRRDVASGAIKPNGISTGIPKLDRLLYHKGWGRKELTAIMAGAKRGKSVSLGDFAIRGSQLGYNALYVTLEVSTDIISDRMDANVTSTKMGELADKFNEVEEKVKSKGRAAKRGELRLVEFPSGSLTPSGLRRVIEKYKGDGIQFDLIVVDYADIMAPDVYTTSPIENSKQIWLGLRAIAAEEEAAVLTATQTNRDGFKADTAKAEDVAEDFNKVRIADLLISLNATDEELTSGDARLFFAASRNQAGSFTIQIKRDLERMKAITSIVSVT